MDTTKKYFTFFRYYNLLLFTKDQDAPLSSLDSMASVNFESLENSEKSDEDMSSNNNDEIEDDTHSQDILAAEEKSSNVKAKQVVSYNNFIIF